MAMAMGSQGSSFPCLAGGNASIALEELSPKLKCTESQDGDWGGGGKAVIAPTAPPLCKNPPGQGWHWEVMSLVAGRAASSPVSAQPQVTLGTRFPALSPHTHSRVNLGGMDTPISVGWAQPAEMPAWHLSLAKLKTNSCCHSGPLVGNLFTLDAAALSFMEMFILNI